MPTLFYHCSQSVHFLCSTKTIRKSDFIGTFLTLAGGDLLFCSDNVSFVPIARFLCRFCPNSTGAAAFAAVFIGTKVTSLFYVSFVPIPFVNTVCCIPGQTPRLRCFSCNGLLQRSSPLFPFPVQKNDMSEMSQSKFWLCQKSPNIMHPMSEMSHYSFATPMSVLSQ